MSLVTRFKSDVLGNPKSFTQRDFSQIQAKFTNLLDKIHAFSPSESEPTSPSADERSSMGGDIRPPSICDGNGPQISRRESRRKIRQADLATIPEQACYWNEYDNGSEAGEPEDCYTIFINPDESDSIFPDMTTILAILTLPLSKARRLFHRSDRHHWLSDPTETSALLPATADRNRPNSVHTTSDSDGYSSADEFLFSRLHALHSSRAQASPFTSPQERHAALFKKNALFWGALGAFILSFVLLGIAGVLLATGRKKARIEVDAGVTLGAVASLSCAVAALCMTWYRGRLGRVGIGGWCVVGATFAAAAVLDCLLLVVVVGDTRWRGFYEMP